VQFTDEQIWALLRNPARHPPSARHLGFELIDFSVDAGWAEVAVMPWPEFANPAGMVLGGFICAMLEDAMGVTASISQRLARVIGRGEVLRMGQTTTHLEGRLRLPGSTLLATATATAVLRPFPNMSRGPDPATLLAGDADHANATR
jgi:acyl-coenzyme A thioesterase PaaI-like protein